MDVLALVNVVAYIVVAIVEIIGNSTFLLTLCISKKIQRTLGTSAILLGVLALNDFINNAVVLPLRIWNMAVGDDGVNFFYNSRLCMISSRAFYAFPQVSAWLLCALAGCRACAVYTPHFYRHKFRRASVRFALAAAALFLAWFTPIIGDTDNWIANIPLSYTGGTCEAVPVSNTSPRDQFMYAVYVQVEFWKGFWIPMPLGMVFYGLVYLRLLWQKRRQVAAAQQQRHVGGDDGRGLNGANSRFAFSVQDGSVGNTNTETAAKYETTGTRAVSNKTLPATPKAAQSVAIAGATSAALRTLGPQRKHASSQRTLARLRLLAINHTANALLQLPGGLAYATQAYTTAWGASVPWLWAILNIFNLCALAANPIVFAATSEDIRSEYKRIFMPTKWSG